MHYRADITSRAKAKTNLAFTVILDIFKATVRFFILARVAQLSNPHLVLFLLNSSRRLLYNLRRNLSRALRAYVFIYTTKPIHLLFNFVLQNLELICVDELGKRIYLLLVKKRYEIVTKTPHFTVPVQYQLVFKAGQTCTF